MTLVLISIRVSLHEFTIDQIIRPECLKGNDEVLKSAGEIWKADAAAASTLMTLLPALLIFGPFPTARIGSLIVYSTLASLITAGFTLGLATTNVMTLPKTKLFRVVDLLMDANLLSSGESSHVVCSQINR